MSCRGVPSNASNPHTHPGAVQRAIRTAGRGRQPHWLAAGAHTPGDVPRLEGRALHDASAGGGAGNQGAVIGPRLGLARRPAELAAGTWGGKVLEGRAVGGEDGGFKKSMYGMQCTPGPVAHL